VPKFPPTYDRLTSLRFHSAVFLSLLPVVALSAYQHGPLVVVNTLLAVLTAWGSDLLWRRWSRVTSPQDGSAPLWGLLLALLLPVNAPFVLPVAGAAFAVFVVKGLAAGSTPWLNPVLAAWAFLQAGWPAAFARVSAEASRSPWDERTTEWLNANVFSWLSVQLPPGYVDLVLGWGHPSSAVVAETGTIFLLAATVYLLAKGYVPWVAPAAFFVGFAVPMVAIAGNTLYHVLSGTLLMNLFLLVADPSSRPLSRGRLVGFAVGAGVLAFALRQWGTGPDSVGYAVLLLNATVPWLDRKFRRKQLNDFRLA